MKLVRAQVQNFRSVEDSDVFTIDGEITCLVGKNESGKTSLLTALNRINPILTTDKQFNWEHEYPRRYHSDYKERHAGKHPTVTTTWWELEEEDKAAVVEELGENALTGNEIRVTKGYDNVVYWSVPINEKGIVEHLIFVSELHDEEKATIGTNKTIAELKAQVTALPDPSPRKTALLQAIGEKAPKDSAHSAVTKLLELPEFLLFSQYQRMDGRVSLENVQKKKVADQLEENDQVFLALCDMAGVTLEEATTIQDSEKLIASFEGASNKISREIFKYWTQNRFLKVRFELKRAEPGDPPPLNSGRVFHTRIYNELHEATVKFDDRSTGFVWFFSFLALFSQVKKRSDKKIILLLDEPGLSLHGKAQADLLRYFKERLAPNHQVIFTTHSPFMVPPDNLLCARTVEDVAILRKDEPPEVFGTKVGSEVLSTDRDTLFPLQGALGYEITQTLFVGKHTLLVEGPGDLLYLRAMSEELRSQKRTHLDQRWTICPCGGIDKVSAFMSLFGGNSLHIGVLTDFATGQKKKVDDLRRSKILRDGHVLTMDSYSGQSEADIEDVLGAPLYCKLVNSCYSLDKAQAVTSPTSAGRIVKHVEEHFRTLPNTVEEFDHYAPAAYFTEQRSLVLKKIPELELNAVLDRFQKLFADLNSLLERP